MKNKTNIFSQKYIGNFTKKLYAKNKNYKFFDFKKISFMISKIFYLYKLCLHF